jgi:peptidyl-prolyl cis-trans isomerase B (cyclophilin B)
MRTHTPIPMLLLAVALTVPVVAGCCAADTAQPPAPPVQQTQSPPTPPEPLHVSTTKTDDVERAVFETSRGRIEVTFRDDKAPNTVASFVELAEKGFFDGTRFHRVEPGFVVQGGDPATKDPDADPATIGRGNPGWRLAAEFNDLTHERGVLAAARSAHPDSAGSQFYFTLAPAPRLDGGYTVFGKVVKGMDVVDRIQVGDTLESVKIVRDK